MAATAATWSILQCDDLVPRRARLDDLGVRVIWQSDLPTIAGTHLHPRDVGGAILSLDQAAPTASSAWAGASWEDHIRQEVVTGIAGVVVGADDPPKMARRWAEVIDAPLGADGTSAELAWGAIRFEPAGPRGEGVDAIELSAANPRCAPARSSPPPASSSASSDADERGHQYVRRSGSSARWWTSPSDWRARTPGRRTRR